MHMLNKMKRYKLLHYVAALSAFHGTDHISGTRKMHLLILMYKLHHKIFEHGTSTYNRESKLNLSSQKFFDDGKYIFSEQYWEQGNAGTNKEMNKPLHFWSTEHYLAHETCTSPLLFIIFFHLPSFSRWHTNSSPYHPLLYALTFGLLNGEGMECLAAWSSIRPNRQGKQKSFLYKICLKMILQGSLNTKPRLCHSSMSPIVCSF